MALPTYLSVINKVLTRMRETAVTDLSDEYTVLVGTFVNDAKSQVEAAHDWSGLRSDITILTVVNQYEYSLVGAGSKIKIDSVYNTTSASEVVEARRRWIDRERKTTPSGAQAPTFYANDGVDTSGDAIITLYPKPDAIYTLSASAWQRTADLAAAGDTIAVPEQPIYTLALALAVRERGEVTGQAAIEYFEIAKRSLSDEIQYDSARNEDEDTWYWV